VFDMVTHWMPFAMLWIVHCMRSVHWACAECVNFGECLLHVSTFATTRMALPTGVKPG
jgi:hypothetical protein